MSQSRQNDRHSSSSPRCPEKITNNPKPRKTQRNAQQQQQHQRIERGKKKEAKRARSYLLASAARANSRAADKRQTRVCKTNTRSRPER